MKKEELAKLSFLKIKKANSLLRIYATLPSKMVSQVNKIFWNRTVIHLLQNLGILFNFEIVIADNKIYFNIFRKEDNDSNTPRIFSNNFSSKSFRIDSCMVESPQEMFSGADTRRILFINPNYELDNIPSRKEESIYDKSTYSNDRRKMRRDISMISDTPFPSKVHESGYF